MIHNKSNSTAIAYEPKIKHSNATNCPEKGPNTPIEDELDNLQEILSRLSENTGSLLARLAAVMSLAENSDSPAPSPAKPLCPLATAIRERVLQTHSINNVVINILQRLEC